MYYVLPSIMALMIKGCIIVWARESLLKKENKDLFAFLVALTALNALEFSQYFFLNNALIGALIIKLYWSLAIISSQLLLSYSARLTAKNQQATKASLLVTIVICTGLLATNHMITGAHSIGFALTATPGTLFIIPKIWIVTLILAGLIHLAHNGMKHKDSFIRKKCTVLLASLLPTMICGISVIALISLGYNASAAVIMPFTISFFMAVLIATEQRYGLFKLLSVIPQTRENKLYSTAVRCVEKTIEDMDTNETIDFKQRTKEFETLIFKLVVEKCDNNKTQAAKKLNISRTTLNKRL